MTKRQTIIITALSLAVFILALMVSGRFWFRLDLTKSRAYTISQVSRNLHREIPDIVNITYYLSDRLRTFDPAPGEIEDTLMEYVTYSRGKIRLTVRDPVKTGLAKAVEELGLQPRQIQNVEQDQASLTTVYSGIVIEYLDKAEVLPWVIFTDTLEYDLTSRIRSMIYDTQRLIGVIAGDSYRQWYDDFSYLNMILNNAGFRVRVFNPGEEIPDTIPALFVLGGAETLDEWALYRIDRYIQMGGKVLFAVEGIFVDAYGTMQARQQNDLGLVDMIGSYGAVIRPELTLDRNALTLQYQAMTQSGVQYRITRYPLWISVLPSSGNPEHPVSSGFAGLDLYWASPLELYPPAGVKADILFTSTNEAWSARDYLYTNPEVSYMLEMEADLTRGVKILGAALSGTFPSFFFGSGKPEREGSDEELPDMPEHARESRIIVVGDSDFASDILSATQNISYGEHHNLDFLLRAADWLVNDDDIIGIRSRLPQAGRFDKISDDSRRAAAMRFSQIVNVVLIPFFIIAAGIFFTLRRRSIARNAENKLSPVQAEGLSPVKEPKDDL
ncbi:MAG: GldG family protein [Treponema sp.]|jgi:ABC-type uncharacterized transport system involved in gliding motility auxiliary subunit|nr:GldG family protein [Treponema sp.]